MLCEIAFLIKFAIDSLLVSLLQWSYLNHVSDRKLLLVTKPPTFSCVAIGFGECGQKRCCQIQHNMWRRKNRHRSSSIWHSILARRPVVWRGSVVPKWSL